jgi:hypothetical protein
MQLCAGFGTKSVVVDLGDGAATHDGANQLFDHSPCGFAAAAAAAPPPADVAFDCQQHACIPDVPRRRRVHRSFDRPHPFPARSPAIA